MQFGLIVQMTGILGYAQPLVRLARDAEAAGWDGFFIWDVFGGDAQAPTPVVDPWIALAAIAMATDRIRIGPMVTPLPRRRPWKLAREAASLDHLSGGRLILGVGIGHQPSEFSRFGEEADARARGRILDEGLEVLTGGAASRSPSAGSTTRSNAHCFSPGRSSSRVSRSGLVGHGRVSRPSAGRHAGTVSSPVAPTAI